eukprot:CAMPEP_0175044714 /NCGR_PEP_ID=MMETSP0052_2-20121109/3980_1 /TAXON_ID=51329 ORGANISM="Polytomella parva, Strain SAG 63-3" /NCGR_SAMPLE_ID=MMETSP0052_2 /ASSEMBLY_ACC=CAM_ASM_000194 /LENGTH=460 /DNA_ID=CAMNT_0016308083 /DNA_START=464 /DNA_END=1842 /DNA_ORIENTATION=+
MTPSAGTLLAMGGGVKGGAVGGGGVLSSGNSKANLASNHGNMVARSNSAHHLVANPSYPTSTQIATKNPSSLLSSLSMTSKDTVSNAALAATVAAASASPSPIGARLSLQDWIQCVFVIALMHAREADGGGDDGGGGERAGGSGRRTNRANSNYNKDDLNGLTTTMTNTGSPSHAEVPSRSIISLAASDDVALNPFVSHFLESRIFPLVAAGQPFFEESDPFAAATRLPQVLAQLDSVKSTLSYIWQYYVLDQEFRDARKMGISAAEIVEARRTLPLPSFLRFASDFRITPTLMTKVQLIETFRASSGVKEGGGGEGLMVATYGGAGSSSQHISNSSITNNSNHSSITTTASASSTTTTNTNTNINNSSKNPHPATSSPSTSSSDSLPLRLTFPEFKMCLIRCALIVFRYSVDFADAVPVIRFTGNYRSAAKSLWRGRSPEEFSGWHRRGRNSIARRHSR